MNSTRTDSKSRSETSSSIFSNFPVPKSCFTIDTDRMPPASPAMMYANISGTPCIAYRSMLNEPT